MIFQITYEDLAEKLLACHEFWTDFEEEAIIQNCPVIEVYISYLPR